MELTTNEVIEQNLIKTKIIRTPKGRNNGNNTFMFAKDNMGIEYFLHYDQLVNGSWNEWASLRSGDEIALKPSKT